MIVETASSGQEALTMLQAAVATCRSYQLALLDVQMPEMDGWTLARALQADPILAGIRLIVLTSVGQFFRPAELKAAGIETYLVKPVKRSRLLECIVDSLGETPPASTTPHFAAPAPVVVSPELDVQLQQVRILLAEDNSVNQKVALAQLGKLGYLADAVASGLEVLEALKSRPYDLILMDCQMPGMDGYEATQAIRLQEQNLVQPASWSRPIYIVAMTAHAMPGVREKCLAVGMDDYLSKPVRPADLLAALERGKRSLLNRGQLVAT